MDLRQNQHWNTVNEHTHTGMRSQETQTLDLPRQSTDGILQKERGNSLNTALLERPSGWKYLYANEGLNVNFFLLQLGGSWETILQLQGSLQASGRGRLWSCTIRQTTGDLRDADSRAPFRGCGSRGLGGWPRHLDMSS